MPTFNPGDKVLLSRDCGYAIGTVEEPARKSDSFAVRMLGGRRLSEVEITEMRHLPPDVPMLQWGSRVRVQDNAPRCVGRPGSVYHGEFIANVFGYWILLLDSNERTWIPADALTVESGED